MTNSMDVCYLCNSTGLEILRDFPWLVKCQHCGLVFNTQLSINSAEVSNQFYDDLNVVHRRKIRSVLLKIARTRWQWMQKRVGLSTGHLLEIGCGTGEFLSIASVLGWDVVGLELSASFREAAKTWYDLDLQGREFSQSGLPKNTFDVVALFHVFEHLPNPLEFLEQIYETVKPGGWMFIIVPNLSSWTDALLGKASPTLIKPDHFFHYNASTLRRIVGRSKFSVVDIVTLEPRHHIWTSLYGFLSLRKKRASNKANSPDKQVNYSWGSKLKSNLPYWLSAITSILLFPLQLWLRHTKRGHEIYLLCRRPL